MEGFALDACADGPGTAGHLHEFIIGFCHVGRTIPGWTACGDTHSRDAEPQPPDVDCYDRSNEAGFKLGT
jgi:hypothetical protein